MKCDICGETAWSIRQENDKNYCNSCYKKYTEERDIVPVEELDWAKIKTLNSTQITKNFIRLVIAYTKNPSPKIYKAISGLWTWACHSDHTVSTLIHEVLAWQKIDLNTEFNRWKGS